MCVCKRIKLKVNPKWVGLDVCSVEGKSLIPTQIFGDYMRKILPKVFLFSLEHTSNFSHDSSFKNSMILINPQTMKKMFKDMDQKGNMFFLCAFVATNLRLFSQYTWNGRREWICEFNYHYSWLMGWFECEAPQHWIWPISLW